MARPKKQTVDYFPHFANTHGKTIVILESKYGNDGYAFWFKLLEILCTTNNHIYDCRNSMAWEFLQAKTRTSEDIASKILQTLVGLEAIDRGLWKHKIIWVQNLVDNIADVYKNRRAEVPQKPSINKGELIWAEVSTSRNPDPDSIPTSEKPQSKVKYSKVDIYNVFDFWNAQQIIQHNKLTDDTKRAVETKLKDFSHNEIHQAIKNYAEILGDEQYYFKYKWTLKDFLKRGLEKFMDLEIAKSNYHKDSDLRGSGKAKKDNIRSRKYLPTN